MIKPFRRFRWLPPAMFYAIFLDFLVKNMVGVYLQNQRNQINSKNTVQEVFGTLLFPRFFEGVIRV